MVSTPWRNSMHICHHYSTFFNSFICEMSPIEFAFALRTESYFRFLVFMPLPNSKRQPLWKFVWASKKVRQILYQTNTACREREKSTHAKHIWNIYIPDYISPGRNVPMTWKWMWVFVRVWHLCIFFFFCWCWMSVLVVFRHYGFYLR